MIKLSNRNYGTVPIVKEIGFQRQADIPLKKTGLKRYWHIGALVAGRNMTLCCLNKIGNVGINRLSRYTKDKYFRNLRFDNKCYHIVNQLLCICHQLTGNLGGPL